MCAKEPRLMIELLHDNIVPSSFSQAKTYLLSIIEIKNCTVVKNTQVINFIINGAFLCVFDTSFCLYLWEQVYSIC